MGCTAAVAAGTSVLGWAWGPLLDRVGEPLMLLGFLACFAGFAVVMAVVVTDRAERPREPRDASALFSCLPTRIRRALVLMAIMAGMSAAAGLISTGGWSTELKGEHVGCEWSLVKGHGATTLCVSHDRWLRTARGFEHGFLGFLAIFASAEAAALAASTARRQTSR